MGRKKGERDMIVVPGPEGLGHRIGIDAKTLGKLGRNLLTRHRPPPRAPHRLRPKRGVEALMNMNSFMEECFLKFRSEAGRNSGCGKTDESSGASMGKSSVR